MATTAATREFGRAMRLLETGIPVAPGDDLSKSAVSRRFKALTQARHDEWMSSDISHLGLVAIRIDGLHMRDEDGMPILGAAGVDLGGTRHALGVVEDATENAAAAQALLDNLIERGLVDGSKASSKAIRRTFGANIPNRRCQVRKSRNILDHLPKGRRESVRRALRRAWNMSDAEKAETVIRHLARRLERDAPGVSRSILVGINEILAVTRPGPPPEPRKSLGSTNIIESTNGVVRRVGRNVKRRRDASIAPRQPSSGMFEARKGFRRINACRQLPLLEQALARHRSKSPVDAMEDAA